MKKIHAFPVDRENPGPSSIKTPIKLLKEGKIVGIFPSGTRTSEDVPLKRGAVTIAQMGKAPLVPAAYKGPSTGKALFKREKCGLSSESRFFGGLFRSCAEGEACGHDRRAECQN